MTVRRDMDPVDGNRTVTVVEDAQPVVDDHAVGYAEEGERVTHRPSGYDLARGWMRTFNLIVGFVLLLIETTLAFRLAFKLSGANANNGFVNFIYDISNPFISPFKGIANHTTSGSTIFEPETVIAMGVWAAVAILLIVLVKVVTSAPAPSETSSTSRERYARVDRHS